MTTAAPTCPLCHKQIGTCKGHLWPGLGDR